MSTLKNNTKKVAKTKLPEMNLKQKGKLILSKELKKNIDYLHSKVGEIEWSGVLLYRILKGSVDTPSELVIEATDLYLMDIGTAAYTEFDLEYDDIKCIHELHPESDPFKKEDNGDKYLRKGMIHTHHSMKAYFSSTDDEELHDNTPNHDIYLSLIVNFDGKYAANLAFLVETSGEYQVVGRKEILRSSETKYLARIDLDISIDVDIDVAKEVKDRYLEVSRVTTVAATTPNLSAFSALYTDEFLQRLLTKLVPEMKVEYGLAASRKKHIKKWIAKVNKNFRKLSVEEINKELEGMRNIIIPAVKSVLIHDNAPVTPETVIDYIDEVVDYIYNDFIHNKTPKTCITHLIIDYLESKTIENFEDAYSDVGLTGAKEKAAKEKEEYTYGNYGSYGNYYDPYDESYWN